MILKERGVLHLLIVAPRESIGAKNNGRTSKRVSVEFGIYYGKSTEKLDLKSPE